MPRQENIRSIFGGLASDDACVLPFPGGALCVPSALTQQAQPTWFDPVAMSGISVTEGGRQAAWFVQGPFGAAVLRHYRRGGLRARLGRQAYLWLGAARTRSFAEFRVLAHLRARGVAVPPPLGAAYWRSGLQYRAAILVGRIAQARTLASCLLARESATGGLESLSDADLAGVPKIDPVRIAQQIYAMHQADVSHADLNAHNILLGPDGAVCLIDFDRARLGVVSAGQRRKNLLRLRRSLVKVCGAPGARWWDSLCCAYDQLPNPVKSREGALP